MIENIEDHLTRRFLPAGTCSFSGGGGGSSSSQPTSVTNTTSNLPEYARPYFETLLNRTNDVSNRDYQPYPGQRLAATSDMTNTSRNMTADIAAKGAPDLDNSRYMLGAAGGAAANAVNYRSGYDTSSYDPHQITTGTFGQGEADRYMSPYMQNVVDVQKNQAVLDYQRGGSARDDSAIRAGAFGGSRQAIQAGLAQEGLARQLGQIQATGSQNAFQQAQAQFNADQGRSLTAQHDTEASAQFGANFNDSSNRYAEDARARAMGIERDGGAAALATAAGYGSLATTDQNLGLARADALGKAGAGMEAHDQAGLDIASTDWLNQRDFDKNQLNFYSGILRGTPVSASSDVSTYSNPNPLNSVVGAGIAGLGAYKAFA